jgi:hypothetical protein
MSPADLRIVHSSPEDTRKGKIWLWSIMIVGLIATGVAFTYKMAEFIYTLTSEEVKGFADVPVTVYFVVAAGWLFLLAWCFLSGKFHDLEKSKYEMLDLEAEYERRGE